MGANAMAPPKTPNTPSNGMLNKSIQLPFVATSLNIVSTNIKFSLILREIYNQALSEILSDDRVIVGSYSDFSRTLITSESCIVTHMTKVI